MGQLEHTVGSDRASSELPEGAAGAVMEQMKTRDNETRTEVGDLRCKDGVLPNGEHGLTRAEVRGRGAAA